MRPARWSSHAEKKLLHREIDRVQTEKTLEEPDEIIPIDPSRVIYQRLYFDELLNQHMLLRVVVEETAHERVVITLYKTSRLQKYRGR